MQNRRSMFRLKVAFTLASALFLHAGGQAVAQETDASALAAVQAFMKDPEAAYKPEGKFDINTHELRTVAEGGRRNAFGPAKLVYADKDVAIAAIEMTEQKLTQTFYVLARSIDGTWRVTDWSSFSNLGNSIFLADAFAKSDDAKLKAMLEEQGGEMANGDVQQFRESITLTLGSDEDLIAGLEVELDRVAALCRLIAKTEDVMQYSAQADALSEKASGNPDVAKILEEAQELGVAHFWREADSAVIGLIGIQPDGRPYLSAARYLLCTPNEDAIALQSRLHGGVPWAVRDLGDNLYFLRTLQSPKSAAPPPPPPYRP